MKEETTNNKKIQYSEIVLFLFLVLSLFFYFLNQAFYPMFSPYALIVGLVAAFASLAPIAFYAVLLNYFTRYLNLSSVYRYPMYIVPAIVFFYLGINSLINHELISVTSPDQSVQAKAHLNAVLNHEPGCETCIVLSIYDLKGSLLFRENTRASNIMRWSLKWEGNDKLIMKSSDIGDIRWVRLDDGSWMRMIKTQGLE